MQDTTDQISDTNYNILVWLPSPMGDAILAVPALRAIRRHFKSAKITFLSNPVVREVLAGSGLNNEWLVPGQNFPLIAPLTLRRHKFTHAILFKNSFASALTVYLAAISVRVGYSREGRGIFLTDKLVPLRNPDGRFKPLPMLDYYLAIASRLGCDTTDRKLELSLDAVQNKLLLEKLPQIEKKQGPLVVLIPGGAFGPSKCWLPERFAQTADRLIADYNATVVVSVSPSAAEKQIANKICDSSANKLINLAENPVTLSQLKSLLSMADLVIANDTGPRHIAAALGRNVITLFGPNDPQWTETGYENEIKIVSHVPCAPCTKPVCTQPEHFCMEAITVEMVCNASKELLEKSRRAQTQQPEQEFVEISPAFFVRSDYRDAFRKSGLTSVEAVFAFTGGTDLTKKNLASYRGRLRFKVNQPSNTLFLKRYHLPPIWAQLKNWLNARKRISFGFHEAECIRTLRQAGVNTANVVSYGWQQGILFERKSFIITEEIPRARSLESKLPPCFYNPPVPENLKLRRAFINRLAQFIRKFHQTGYRHRDLYFSHIFYGDNNEFYLIDLARAFKPLVFSNRFRVKDVAQIYYSAPAKYFSATDRLRFYHSYTGRGGLAAGDKLFIRKVINKANRIARHDSKHSKSCPFAC